MLYNLIGNPPPSLVNYSITNGYGFIRLDWIPDNLSDGISTDGTKYRVEVFKSDTPVFAAAVQIATVYFANFYVDPVANGLTKYYWLRLKNKCGKLGSFSNMLTGTSLAVNILFSWGDSVENTCIAVTIEQIHNLLVATSITANSSTTGTITQVHIIQNIDDVQVNLSAEIYELVGTNATQDNAADTAAITQIHAILVDNVSQANESGTGTI